MDLAAKCAADLMNAEVATIKETATLAEAANQMKIQKVSSLVVEKRNKNDAFGIITRKDIVDALGEERFSARAEFVEDMMSKPALIVAPSLSVTHCLQIMKMVGVRRLPVVDNEKLVGILSNTNLFDHLVEEL